MCPFRSCAGRASPLAPTVLLAPNLAMPAVALGTGEYKGDACVAAVTSAIGLGYRNIDTLSATVELKEHG